MDYKFGYVPDKVDPRDYRFESIKKFTFDDLPTRINMRKDMTPIENQNPLNSCVAQAVVGSLECLYLRRFFSRWPCFRYRDYSRLFVYYWARYLDGWQDFDDGCRIRTAIKSIRRYGICQEKYWPYDIQKWSVMPNKESCDKAAKRKIKDYYRVETTDDFLSALAGKLPVIFGAELYSSFNSDPARFVGKVPLPKKDEKMIGRHAMLAVGYNLKTERIIVRNSWGAKWGSSGYCYMPLAYFMPLGKLVHDCWVVRTHPNY
jgi:C1A family cysteine protease